MATLDSLPGDQRAVLQLVLQRGRTYDDIASLLSIDRAAVRQRALAAFDALGPQTGVEAERRALITDYLLGQLPARVSEHTREGLADSPNERAWARVVASELTPMAVKPLPEIPVESSRREAAPDAEPRQRTRAFPRRAREATEATSAADEATATAERERASPRLVPPRRGPAVPGGPRSSRLGGALLLLLALVVIIIAVVLIASGGSSKKHTTTATASVATTTTATSTTSAAATTTPQVVRQINLVSPGAPATKTAGLADVLRQGATDGIAIIAQHVPPNTKHNAYAVWLYNSPTDSHILGFVNPGVGSNGRLSTAGALPADASHFKQLIVTLETQGNPRQPGQIILQGPLSLS